MKKYLSLIIFSLIVFSCKKQNTQHAVQNEQDYLANVEAYLKNNLSAADFVNADFKNMYLGKEPGSWLLRVGLQGKKIEQDFILLKTDSLGNCSGGRFVHIQRDRTDMRNLTGRISTESLQHDAKDEQSIPAAGSEIIPSNGCNGCLPPVVVIGYSNGGDAGGISYADYLNLMEIANGGISSSTGIYSPVSPALYAGSGGSLIQTLPNVTVSYENSYAKPGIDVNSFMKCFASIPDAGATCSVTIYTDLPVNDNPSYIFNILTGATGHVFLSLTKTNGSASITQYIGKTTSKAIAVLGFPVAGKIVDNSDHKYNSSLTMNITPSQLQTEINTITAIGSTPSYDMWENNCVDYALGIVNAVRPGNPLYVGMSIDPSTGDAYQTPQSLYIALDNLKKQNGQDAANITMDVVSNAGSSHGTCN